ncbi:heme ABC transporter ATP-binding protein [Niabella sp. CJ426]|uniref:heme ABC transporter ATP-binding protein n=1 Tax=Niabella sp. CJ426 TaxID=3393740 RepID=UPI003CFD1125
MLKVENVSYEIKKRAIVKDVTLTIRPGEFVALLGANGAGKSTLLRLISGEQQPSKGGIELYGKPLHQYTPDQAAPLKAILSQHNPLTMAFTCREIVMMGRYPYHKSRPGKTDELIVDETMDICGVSALEDRSYMQLSGGEQQRVQLARVLAQLWDQGQGLILLDEPVAGLDMLYQQQTMAIAKALASKGYMVLAALHEINLAAQYADRIFMMKNGRRWNDGTPCEVLTAINIYAIYEVEVDIVINPRTLTPYVIAKEIQLSADRFNNSFQKVLTR